MLFQSFLNSDVSIIVAIDSKIFIQSHSILMGYLYSVICTTVENW